MLNFGDSQLGVGQVCSARQQTLKVILYNIYFANLMAFIYKN